MRLPRSPTLHGWVYILVNPSMPGLIKVGHTGRDFATRVAELTAATGVPVPFIIAWAHPVGDHQALETLAHGRLARHRVNSNREFFRCSVERAVSIIEEEAAGLLLPWWRSWLFRLAHPLPSAKSRRRSASFGRRRRHFGEGYEPFFIFAGLVLGWVLVYRPSWMPPGFLQWLHLMLDRLPRL